MTAPDYWAQPVGRCPSCGLMWAMCRCFDELGDEDGRLSAAELRLLTERFGFPHPE